MRLHLPHRLHFRALLLLPGSASMKLFFLLPGLGDYKWLHTGTGRLLSRVPFFSLWFCYQ